MDATVMDRKVWTELETRALISLKGEMKSRFQSMKRNRALWIELSEKLRQQYGHDRTPAQCSVRWKNILSSYKACRDSLKDLHFDGKLHSFFKEVEAIVGDPPIAIAGDSLDPEGRKSRILSSERQKKSPRKRQRGTSDAEDLIIPLLKRLIKKVEEQGAAIARIERLIESNQILSHSSKQLNVDCKQISLDDSTSADATPPSGVDHINDGSNFVGNGRTYPEPYVTKVTSYKKQAPQSPAQTASTMLNTMLKGTLFSRMMRSTTEGMTTVIENTPGKDSTASQQEFIESDALRGKPLRAVGPNREDSKSNSPTLSPGNEQSERRSFGSPPAEDCGEERPWNSGKTAARARKRAKLHANST